MTQKAHNGAEIWYTGVLQQSGPGGALTPRGRAQEGLVPMPDQCIPPTTEETTEEVIPYGYCHCGCGRSTGIAKQTKRQSGHVKGEPYRYARGHGSVKHRAPVVVDPSGEFGVIPLANGMTAIIDRADIPKVEHFRWTVSFTRGRISGVRSRAGGWLHHVIAGKPVTGMIDHADGNPLNNRKSNLRLCTNSQNRANARKQEGASSRFKGVSWNTALQRWIVQVRVNKQVRKIGEFDDEVSAARCYDDAAREAFGEFACLNFPDEGEQFALKGKLVG